MPERMLEHEFVATSVAHALVRVFHPDQYFDICVVDSCLTALGRGHGRGYDLLRPMHCVSWSSVSETMREEVLERVMELLIAGPATDLEVQALKDCILGRAGPPVEQTKARGILGFLKRGA